MMDPANIPDRWPRDPDDVPAPTGHYCHYRNRPCPPFCSALLGGCEDIDDREDDE